MPSGVASAAFWKPSYMLAQDVALFGDGAEPPPDRIEPSRNWVICALVTDPRSAWVIWPIFSSRLIRESRSFTRVGTGRLGSRYGSPAALAGTISSVPITTAAEARSRPAAAARESLGVVVSRTGRNIKRSVSSGKSTFVDVLTIDPVWSPA